MKTNKSLVSRCASLALLCMIAFSAAAQQDLRTSLFAQADEALKAADEARANILAPKNYGDAIESYQKAEEKLEKGRSIESIKKDLDSAAQSLRKAVDATRLAGVTLTSAIQARNDAEEANAAQFASREWRDAEFKFAQAATRLEDGNVNSARSRAATAEKDYRAAELTAIKVNYLDETKRLITKAEDMRAERYAPRTLAKAIALLAQAEKALTENRYDTDEPRSLARQAKYEAKHAAYLTQTLKPVRDRDVTLEDYALTAEQPIESIGASLDLVVELDRGYEGPTNEIRSRIEALQKDSYELSERRGQILELETEIQGLEGRLGTQSQRLAAQEEQRQKFSKIESMFGANEAQVFTQGPNVLIRPIGLIFPSGSAQIETQYFALLTKVQNAIKVFPNSLIVVEGHTDSFGGDETNLKLSINRAAAVRQYLLANMTELSAADVTEAGFGESRPVANNETAEGRARNRRIDLVIRPKPAAN